MKKGNVSRNKDRVGEKYTTNQGYEIEIIEYFDSLNCTIRVNDWNNTVLYNVRYSHVLIGNIKNPYHPSVINVGYYGIGDYRAVVNKVPTFAYKTWMALLKRNFCKIYQEKQPSYKDCSVDVYWYNFQVFGKWCEQNYNPKIMEGWHLDKDILVKGNKVYSPETCCFVPQEINTLFVSNNIRRGKFSIGVSKPKNSFIAHVKIRGVLTYLGSFKTEIEAFQVYKTAKEDYIKEVADKWKSQITEKVYQAMYNYKVEIDD